MSGLAKLTIVFCSILGLVLLGTVAIVGMPTTVSAGCPAANPNCGH